MGLDVMFYVDAKPYHCPCLKKGDDIVTYWEKEGTRMASNLNYVYSSEHDDYQEATFEYWDLPEGEGKCKCRDMELKSIDVGRISHYDHDGVFKPGQMIEFKSYDGFYFGSMGKCRMLGEEVDNYCREKDIADPMSEMDWNEGFYTGKYLYWFKRQLEFIVHINPQLEVYRKLLDTVSDEDLVTKCVVIHC